MIALLAQDSPKDQHATQRLLSNLRVQRLVHECDIRGAFILCPFLQVVLHKYDIIEAPGEFGQVGFKCTLAQVASAGLDNCGFVVFQAER